MGEVVAESKGSLQILVFDHAPESVWGGLADVVLVEEWRGGKAHTCDLAGMIWINYYSN
jgi:hypothetical protein